MEWYMNNILIKNYLGSNPVQCYYYHRRNPDFA